MDIQGQAQTLVRDILTYVLAGRIDEEARITFAGWITDALEAAVEAKATELSVAAGCPHMHSLRSRSAVCPTAYCAVGGPLGVAGPVDATTLAARVTDLLDTLGQLFRWVAEALPVVSAAYAAADHPEQLAALAQAVGQYRARLAAQPPANQPTPDDQSRAREAAGQGADTPEVRP